MTIFNNHLDSIDSNLWIKIGKHFCKNCLHLVLKNYCIQTNKTIKFKINLEMISKQGRIKCLMQEKLKPLLLCGTFYVIFHLYKFLLLFYVFLEYILWLLYRMYILLRFFVLISLVPSVLPIPFCLFLQLLNMRVCS